MNKEFKNILGKLGVRFCSRCGKYLPRDKGTDVDETWNYKSRPCFYCQKCYEEMEQEQNEFDEAERRYEENMQDEYEAGLSRGRWRKDYDKQN